MQMAWKPLDEEELWDLMNAAEARMTVRQSQFWEAIRIMPEKWAQHPFGDPAGGFWAVAILGRKVVWYNEIEGGFNRSRYTSYGTIGKYWSNQDALELTIQHLLTSIELGYDAGGFCGPPQPVR